MFLRKYLHKNERGNTLILVIAILTVLTILASTTYYISTLENISSNNFSSNVKSKFAALGNLPEAERLFFQNRKCTAFTQGWAQNVYKVQTSYNRNSGGSVLRDDNSGVLKSSNQSNSSYNQYKTVSSNQETFVINDESSRININAVGILGNENMTVEYSGASTFEIDLGEYLEEVIKNEFSALSPGMGTTLAKKIIQYRYGPDGKPGRANYDDDGDYKICQSDAIDNDFDGDIDEAGEGIDEPDEFISDPRIEPYGDDRPYQYLNDLYNIKSVDEEIIQAIAPFVTVYSSSDNLVYINDEPVVPININKASVEQILKQLEMIYDLTDEEMLIQYTLNVVDARDKDSIPTSYNLEGQTILGLEVTPYINEVYADSKSFDEDGDDGQYVEIYNPYSKDIDVEGWKITAMNTVYLTGKVKAGGYLIITDDYDESQDPDPEDDEDAYGSFFDLFGIIPDGNQKRMIESPFFDIDNQSGTVALEDENGNVIDIFEYSGGESSFGYKSFQRNDPRLRYCELSECTPYSNSTIFDPPDSYKKMLTDRENMDKPFTSPVELMKIYAGYVDLEDYIDKSWIYPEIVESNTKISSNIIDLFKTVEGQIIRQLDNDELMRIDEDNLENYYETNDRADIIIGLININTTNKYALMSLPGMDGKLAENIIEYAIETENDFTQPIYDRIPFRRVSDLLRKDDIWDEMNVRDRIDTFSKIYNLLTVRSNVCSIQSEGFDYASVERKPLAKSFVMAMICYENEDRSVLDLRMSDYFVKPYKIIGK